MSVFLNAALAFNLICSVTSYGARNQTVYPKNPEKMELSIDLETKRWCGAREQCTQTLPIQEVTDSYIIFLNIKEGTGKGRTSYTISRESGEFSFYERDDSGDFAGFTFGHCEKAPFTGFPQPKF